MYVQYVEKVARPRGDDFRTLVLEKTTSAATLSILGLVSRDVVPDMPDGIIAATALHLGLPLVTRDQRIQSAGIKTIW